jgi:hypothetical protein
MATCDCGRTNRHAASCAVTLAQLAQAKTNIAKIVK